jgi:ubiquinone/menaquinone biosynthesis C-methylase UbiE
MRPYGYEDLADEYYDPRHITSRNFEAATAYWIAVNGCPIPGSGLVLDIGTGRGSAAAFCNVESSRIIESDIALAMLKLSPRPPSRARVVCDALSIPFPRESFCAVTAFLFDPFNSHTFIAESYRVLEPVGVFLGTLPHQEWGKTLRSLRGGPSDVARFVSNEGSHVDKPSYLLGEKELRRRFLERGYRSVDAYTLTLPRTETTVSPDISDPAATRGVSPHDLPIVQLIIARKP